MIPSSGSRHALEKVRPCHPHPFPRWRGSLWRSPDFPVLLAVAREVAGNRHRLGTSPAGFRALVCVRVQQACSKVPLRFGDEALDMSKSLLRTSADCLRGLWWGGTGAHLGCRPQLAGSRSCCRRQRPTPFRSRRRRGLAISGHIFVIDLLMAPLLFNILQLSFAPPWCWRLPSELTSYRGQARSCGQPWTCEGIAMAWLLAAGKGKWTTPKACGQATGPHKSAAYA